MNASTMIIIALLTVLGYLIKLLFRNKSPVEIKVISTKLPSIASSHSYSLRNSELPRPISPKESKSAIEHALSSLPERQNTISTHSQDVIPNLGISRKIKNHQGIVCKNVVNINIVRTRFDNLKCNIIHGRIISKTSNTLNDLNLKQSAIITQSNLNTAEVHKSVYKETQLAHKAGTNNIRKSTHANIYSIAYKCTQRASKIINQYSNAIKAFTLLQIKQIGIENNKGKAQKEVKAISIPSRYSLNKIYHREPIIIAPTHNMMNSMPRSLNYINTPSICSTMDCKNIAASKSFIEYTNCKNIAFLHNSYSDKLNGVNITIPKRQKINTMIEMKISPGLQIANCLFMSPLNCTAEDRERSYNEATTFLLQRQFKECHGVMQKIIQSFKRLTSKERKVMILYSQLNHLHNLGMPMMLTETAKNTLFPLADTCEEILSYLRIQALEDKAFYGSIAQQPGYLKKFINIGHPESISLCIDEIIRNPENTELLKDCYSEVIGQCKDINYLDYSTTVQLNTMIELLTQLCNKYKISIDSVEPHVENPAHYKFNCYINHHIASRISKYNFTLLGITLDEVKIITKHKEKSEEYMLALAEENGKVNVYQGECSLQKITYAELMQSIISNNYASNNQITYSDKDFTFKFNTVSINKIELLRKCIEFIYSRNEESHPYTIISTAISDYKIFNGMANQQIIFTIHNDDSKIRLNIINSINEIAKAIECIDTSYILFALNEAIKSIFGNAEIGILDSNDKVISIEEYAQRN